MVVEHIAVINPIPICQANAVLSYLTSDFVWDNVDSLHASPLTSFNNECSVISTVLFNCIVRLRLYNCKGHACILLVIISR